MLGASSCPRVTGMALEPCWLMALLFAQLTDVHRYVTPDPPQHAGAQDKQAGTRAQQALRAQSIMMPQT